MSKKHPLRIEVLGDECDYWEYYSKGHHDLTAFVEAVAKEAGCLPSEVRTPRHEWKRARPAPKGDDYGWYMEDGIPGRRGTFPVTICDA